MEKSDNELIAEFMGKEPQSSSGGKPAIFTGENTLTGWEFLKYDKSWDWLMPVVERIEHEGYEVDVYKNVCEISTGDMIREVSGTKIDACYKAVVEFIKWYNENGK